MLYTIYVDERAACEVGLHNLLPSENTRDQCVRALCNIISCANERAKVVSISIKFKFSRVDKLDKGTTDENPFVLKDRNA